MLQAGIIAIVAAIILYAAWQTRRRRKRGGGCCGEREADLKAVDVKDRSKAHYPYQVTLEIGGMTCENCAKKVQNALNALDGVWAKVSIASHSAAVRLKNEPDESALRAAVRDAGYVVTKVEIK